ncbi:MAG: glycoside hydrolase family 97 N-terminal domain-containing protein, partial [Muribaculaceae bacterium]|nr:glycoside hydrolase family 97 N-terminal domain-containing protein [Muribaculaceae bacterium]
MKKIIFACAVIFAATVAAARPVSVSSPDGSISVTVDTGSDGVAYYSVSRNGKTVLEPSRLGLELKDAPSLDKGFSITKVSRATADETWQPVWGEESQIRNHYNELALTLRQKSTGRNLGLRFRVFDDGMGFRYEFPEALGDFAIADELTSFAFPEAHSSWSIPGDKNNYYEAIYRPLPLDSIGYASTPVTIKTADGLSMALHEAALTDYAAMN